MKTSSDQTCTKFAYILTYSLHSHQSWPIPTVGNARQGGELAAGSQHYEFFCCLQWSSREGASDIWQHETKSCRKSLFAILSVSLKFLTNLLKAMNDRHIFSFRMNSGTLEMWEKFALHLMKMDLDNRILVDYRHRRWTVNGVTTPFVSTALKTIRCMFVLPHGDRSRLQLPFSWEKHKLLTCDSLHDIIFFNSWRYLRYFGCRNAASLPNQGEFVACPCECEDTFSPPSFRINMGTRLYLIKAIRLVVPTDGRPEQSAEWSVFVSWLHL